ncbi:MAG: Zn-ribbon domain-containing OB-fold protein [Acidimicrobiales bacterium]
MHRPSRAGENRALKPRPVPDGLAQPFWNGVSEHRLVIQRCRACKSYVHPPYPECTSCRSGDLTFEPVSGRGIIFERVIVESPVVVGFEDDVPYVCLFVELDEQAELLVAGNLVDAAPYEAQIGCAVEVVFREESDGFILPTFKLVGNVSG